MKLFAISLLVSLLAFNMSCTHSLPKQPNYNYKTCTQDIEKQKQRSLELKQLCNEDQKDREKGVMAPGTVFRDRERRVRVAEIFAEGCLLSAEDFYSAGLIFQHGDKPEHYMQALVWFQAAYELKPSPGLKRMVALAADRYLISKGHKQIFGSQAFWSSNGSCLCLQPIEENIPANFQNEYMGGDKTIEKQLEWVDSMNKGKNCPKKNFCKTKLKPSPKGTLPGIW